MPTPGVRTTPTEVCELADQLTERSLSREHRQDGVSAEGERSRVEIVEDRDVAIPKDHLDDQPLMEDVSEGFETLLGRLAVSPHTREGFHVGVPMTGLQFSYLGITKRGRDVRLEPWP